MSAPCIAAFMDRMNETGLSWDDWRFREPLDDGNLRRYDVAGDKPKSRNGWYVLHSGQYPSGCFGSWKTGEQFSWSAANTRKLSYEELELLMVDREQKQQKIDAKLKTAREAACKESLLIWQGAFDADVNHPYLLARWVGAYGIRRYKNSLLIPVRDVSGRLTSLQFISPDGSKYFKSGGRVKGCFHRIGKPVEEIIYIAEGYATAVTIHKLTGHAVAVAFYASNIVDVAIALKKRYPHYQLLIAADNDRFTEGNPGLTQARKAALLTGAGLLIPTFTDDEKGSDFNDRFLLDTFPDVSND